MADRVKQIRDNAVAAALKSDGDEADREPQLADVIDDPRDKPMTPEELEVERDVRGQHIGNMVAEQNRRVDDGSWLQAGSKKSTEQPATLDIPEGWQPVEGREGMFRDEMGKVWKRLDAAPIRQHNGMYFQSLE